MKVGLSLSFDESFFVPSFYVNLFKEFARFSPERLTQKYKTKKWNRSEHIKILENYQSHETIAIGNNNSDIFSIVITGSKHPHRHISIVQENEIFHPSNSEIERIIDHKSFNAGFLYNEDFECVQSTSFIENIDHRNIDKDIWRTIENTPYKIGLFDKKEYDIKFNPGRSVLISYTWLMVAWKMWFGGEFFKLVPKERILSFPYATEIKELPTGQVFVQLYDKIEDPHTPDNIFRQWKWREWLDYDGLEEKYG